MEKEPGKKQQIRYYDYLFAERVFTTPFYKCSYFLKLLTGALLPDEEEELLPVFVCMVLAGDELLLLLLLSLL